MPWDGTELWLAGIDDEGQLVDPGCVAGGKTESIYQPGWGLDGELTYATDRTGWWQLVRQIEGQSPGACIANAPSDSEFGRPQWTFATATWASAGRSRLVVSYAVSGVWHLGVVDTRTGELSPVHTELEPQEWLDATADHAFFIGASPRRAPVLARLALDSGVIEILKESSPAVVDSGYLSIAEAIEFPTSGGRTAHAFFYAPVNPAAGVTAASRTSASRYPSGGERPPLIAISHGGPTAAAVRTLDLRIQYWTSRGFAVVDVNYGGSSGYGRAYRNRLRGSWGHVDVDDMLHVVAFLADAGRIDRERTIIRGGSAGGYTTLAALTFHPGVFKAGASYYGVSDLEVLARDTHKFEARYLDTLVGPYPARADEYRARSPIHAIENLACALILFQGLDDKVVPPNQSEMMADAVRRKGLPVAYVAFEGEQHGFRRAENIVRSLEAELYFYAAVFGFTAADRIAPLTIDNL
jgi:dipeptidyl aminopeptidase/acylaminoacyl peptidase